MIQWPLLLLSDWAANNAVFNCPFNSSSLFCDLDKIFVIYMFFIAPFLVLPIILSIIMAIRIKNKKTLGKLEKWLVVGSWTLSLVVSVMVLSKGGFHT